MTDTEKRGTYHETERGTKWPNCLMCQSETTTIVPKTGEWTCQDCGHQWHSDETTVEAGDASDIGGEIKALLGCLADESPRELEILARERGVDTETERSEEGSI